MARDKSSASDSWRLAGCLAALLLFARISAAQTAPAAAIPAKPAAAAQGISYKDGQLTIQVVNTTLTEVLGKVAKLTGVVIELPDRLAQRFRQRPNAALPKLFFG